MHVFSLSAITNIHGYGKHMQTKIVLDQPAPKDQSDQGLFACFP